MSHNIGTQTLKIWLKQHPAVGTTSRHQVKVSIQSDRVGRLSGAVRLHDGELTSYPTEIRHKAVHSQLAFSCSNFSGSMKGLSMDLIISSPQYTHSDAMMSSMSDFICSRLVPALPFSKLAVSPSSLSVERWRDLEVCAVAASFFCRSSRRVCLKVVR